MKFKSLRQILQFAIAKEESSVRFYKSLSLRVKNTDTAAVFEAIARQEQRHIEAVKLELFKLGYTFAEPTAGSDSQSPEGAVAAADETDSELTYLDALRLGLQKERAAFRLYAELLALAEEEESRKMFADLAEEEMRHILQFEREIAAVSGQPRR